MSAVDPARPVAPGWSGLVDGLVRPGADVVALSPTAGPRALVRSLLLVTLAGAAVFGAVVGASRGGVQIAYAAVKLPLLALVTVVLCAPAFLAIARVAGLRHTPAEILAVALGAAARFALVLAGLSPVLWLLEGVLGYHDLVLAVVACCGGAGVAGALVLVRAFAKEGARGHLAGLAFALAFGVVGLHTSWNLRPFLVRPDATTVPFLRPIEGDVVHSILTSLAGRGRS